MCGYCIQGAGLIPALESAYKGETVKIDGLYISNCLKEEDNLYIAVDKARGSAYLNDFREIVICRLYEQYILLAHSFVPIRLQRGASFNFDVRKRGDILQPGYPS